MTNPSSIVTPLALSETSSAMLCSPWFVDFTPEGPAEFHPLPASYKPLVNGQEAFGAVYDAILAATHTVDIVCWGFQPSMYFKRGKGASLRIGELLIQQALKQKVKVRILCWLDSLTLAQLSEPSMPMYSTFQPLSQNEDLDQQAYDWNWYFRARLSGTGAREAARRAQSMQIGAQVHREGAAASRSSLVAQPLADIGIEVVTRDFSLHDRWEIMYREWLARKAGSGVTLGAIGSYGAEPSHHQKMVLVDYEAPEQAVGFVMGHNTLDAYWDDDGHSYLKKAPDQGRNGATPRQDMSAMVTGPILEHLNVNFCRAWLRDAKEDLLTQRKPLAAQLQLRRDPAMGTPVMAQINRTQSQEGAVCNIKSLYLQAVNNATQFIYIENQYFRWSELAEKIKNAAQRQVNRGRDPGKHGSIHLFVVTNSDDDALSKGQGSTYDMLASLGQARGMPNVYRLEQEDSLNAQNAAALQQLALPRTDTQGQDALEKINAIKQQRARLRNMKDDDIPITDIPGLKVLVCTLVAPDSPPERWMPVYVHSKIMIIDDVFLTHGSANVNRRSMEVDSELNICHEHGGVTQPLRRRLWNIHTGGKGAQDKPAEAFTQWGKIIKRNAERLASKKKAPYASLVGFSSLTKSRFRMD